MWLPGAFAIHLLVLQGRLFARKALLGMSCSGRLAGGAAAFTWLSLCQATRGSLCPAATSAVSGRCRGRHPPQIPPTIRAALLLRPAWRTRLPSTRSSRHCPCRAGAAGIPESARAAPRSAPPCAAKTQSLRPTTPVDPSPCTWGVERRAEFFPLGPLATVSWPWVPAWGSLEPSGRDGENAQKMRKNGEKMGEISPKTFT